MLTFLAAAALSASAPAAALPCQDRPCRLALIVPAGRAVQARTPQTVAADADVYVADVDIDGRRLPRRVAGLRGYWDAPDAAVRLVATAAAGPMTLQAASFSGRHRVLLTWRQRHHRP